LFSYKGVGPLRIIDGTMNKDKYQDILANELVPYIASTSGQSEAQYLHDNARYAKAKSVLAWMENEGVNRMDFPPYSPDLNPIENLWAVLKRNIDARMPTDIEQLTKVTIEEWSKISVTLCQNLVDSMPDRMQAVVAAEGHKTRY
jgi:transposase